MGRDQAAKSSTVDGKDGAVRGQADWKIITMYALAAVVLAYGGWVTFTSWPGRGPAIADPGTGETPTPTPSVSQSAPADASSQASSMAGTLDSMASTRSDVPDTLGNCSSVGADLSVLKRVIQERVDQVTEAQSLSVDQIPSGDSLQQALVTMAQSSLEADQKYLSWAKHADSSSCKNVDPESGTIGAANQTAADAKRGFVGLWNSVAGQYQLTTYIWKDF